MSHTTGRVVSDGTRIGPDTGVAPIGGAWELQFTPQAALAGGPPRFVMLNFDTMAFPGGARLEVDLRYGTDTFDAASGPSAWTRPIDPKPGPIRIRYFGSGAIGGVTLRQYGSGEPTQTGTPGQALGSLTNVDLFLHTDPYVEPIYETRLKCGPFDWENIACAPAGSVAARAAEAVCCFVHVHSHPPDLVVSTCSATLIGSNQILTAAHCATDPNDLEVLSGSVVFGYQTTCAGGRPAGYAPRIFKARLPIRRGNTDWLIFEIDTPAGGTGILPAVLRSSALLNNEIVTAIHHPHGAVKKFQSTALMAPPSITPVTGFDFAGGSSGSPLFDAAGRVIGAALSAGPISGDPCKASYTPSTWMVSELATPPAPPMPFDVMLVMDHSGSMSLPGLLPGRTKMQEARDAASLFVQLVRLGAGDRLGMVAFSTTATRPPDTPLGPVDAARKVALVGPGPYTTGSIGSLVPTDLTSIGDGLAVARDALTPAAANQRAIVLMTDGLQNTPPMVQAMEASLGTIQLIAIGFGRESDLDSALLSRVAHDHRGRFTRANDGLDLKKFFGLAFGNIFTTGALSDPMVPLRASEMATSEVPFAVCEEDRITAILGWDDPSQSLELSLRTPAGVVVAATTPGVIGDRGETWQFLRMALPIAGEREGAWSWQVRRLPFVGELGPEPAPVRLFVTVVADGGPRLEPILPARRIYTGDPITPLVALTYANGTAPHGEITLEIEAPNAAIGQVVQEAGLEPPDIGGDPLPSFFATLRKAGGGAYSLPTRQVSGRLYDDGLHGDGGMEPDGVYADTFVDLTRYEGTYRMRAIALYGETCTGRREAQWALHVELGVDAGRTTVEVRGATDQADGRRQGTLVITPRDRFGSPLGPGRGDRLDLSAAPGTIAGPTIDNRDGTYTVEATWDPSRYGTPGLIVSQPDRPPIPIAPPPTPGVGPGSPSRGSGCLVWLLAVLLVIAIVVIVLLLT